MPARRDRLRWCRYRPASGGPPQLARRTLLPESNPEGRPTLRLQGRSLYARCCLNGPFGSPSSRPTTSVYPATVVLSIGVLTTGQLPVSSRRSSSSASATSIDGSGPPRSRAERRKLATQSQLGVEVSMSPSCPVADSLRPNRFHHAAHYGRSLSVTGRAGLVVAHRGNGAVDVGVTVGR